MVRLHALKSVNEETASSEIDGSLLGDDAALDFASRPEGVPHLAPRVLGISAKVAGTILAHNEAGCGSGECEINDTAGVCARLDVVALAVLGEGDGAALGVEAVLFLVEAVF